MNKDESGNVEVKQEPPGEDDNGQPPENIRVLDHFCRLCLRTHMDLVSLVSYIQGLSIPQVFHSVTGLELVLEDTLPSKACQTCLNTLENGFNLRKRFIESHRLLESFNSSQNRSLVDLLNDIQNADEHSKSETSKFTTRCVDTPIYIKQDPELDLEPDELPEPEPTKSQDANKTIKKRVNNRYNYNIKQAKLDPNKCYICEQVHENTKLLNIHLSTHAEMIPYECEKCKDSSRPVRLTTISMLHKHFQMHSSAIKCPKCPIGTITMGAMYSHMRYYHGEDSNTEYTCQVCEVKIISKLALERHMRHHKNQAEQKHTCSYCQEKFCTKTKLNRHELRRHKDERPFQCHHCIKKFKTHCDRKLHEQSHTGERGYQCEICGKSYQYSSVLSGHITSVHGVGKDLAPLPVLKCDVEGCNFSTTKRSSWYTHSAHHKLKYQCSLCPKRYITGRLLEVHQYSHTGVKELQCNICPKQFVWKKDLDAHVQTHTNPNPFVCDMCGKSFLLKSSFKQHIIRHTNSTMNYGCGHCDKKYRTRYGLVRHEKAHEKPNSRVKSTSLENDNVQSTAIVEEKVD